VRSALLVDAILGQRQVVIKSLESNYQHVQGIAAATILGDGRGSPARGQPPPVSNNFVQQQAKRMTGIDNNQGRRRTDLTMACELIAFRMGTQEFCVDIMSVSEIRGWTKVTALPKSPSFVRGVVNLRGTCCRSWIWPRDWDFRRPSRPHAT
jgi:CheW-like domain